MRSVSDDDVSWTFENFVPRTIDAGVTATATVYPEGAIAKPNVERIGESVEGVASSTDSHTTTEMDEARSWLRER